jgi:hypothetical protein
MRRLLHQFNRLFSARHSLPSLSAVVLGTLALAVPQFAAAEALPGPENKAGPSGLPDGRVYEQVSPTNKFGNEAGEPDRLGRPPYIVAGLDGDSVAFSKSGPFGEAPSGYDTFSIARRLDTGWSSRAAIGRAPGNQGPKFTNPDTGLGFSAEMDATVFASPRVFVTEQEPLRPTPHLYRYNDEGMVQWIGKPTIAEPVRFAIPEVNSNGLLEGASANFDTIYFSYEGALVQADEEPNPALGNLSYVDTLRASPTGSSDNGFYEWHNGTLEAAGVLPDGHLDPYGAVPAATNVSGTIVPEELSNQVSEDGRVAFFVSPDPGAKSGRPSELYVRLTATDGTQTTKLVSRDLLLPESGGQPAGAPTGLAPVGKLHNVFFASPDGSHAFFESLDRLTSDAPADTSVKEYEFDTKTNVFSYLPGVSDLSYTPCVNCESSTILVLRTSRDGSNFLFDRAGRLDLWSEGTVSEIGPIDNPPKVVRGTPDGSVYVFQAKSSFPGFGFNNGNGTYEEIYRYGASDGALSCVSCPPVGVAPSGNAELSHAFTFGSNGFINITGNHGISENGNSVFFDTPDPLLPGDTNGLRDAYEWRNGTVSLVSTGVSKRASFAGDNSLSGNDEFFATAEGLAPGDTDEAYDVYDARVPRPGDQLPPSAVACEGAVCQGPPSVPQLLSQPASEAFSGTGNIEPLPPGHSAAKSLTRKQKLARALKACRHEKKLSRRRACERKARAAYGARAAGLAGHSGGVRHNNGRGK